MPTGVLTSVGSVLLGGPVGGLVGNKLSEHFKAQLMMVSGVCSIGVGVYSIAPMKNMPAVVFALVIGTAIGLIVHLGNGINKGIALIQVPIFEIFPNGRLSMTYGEFVSTLVTIIILFCADDMGIYGSLDSGMTGDSTILIPESVLDFFAATIFACNLGCVAPVMAIPQFIISYILLLLAEFIYPLATPDMILDFKACGGFLMVATGFRTINVKIFSVVDMMPAMVVIMPLGQVWTNWTISLS